jgi:cob(I)alamin adenosyltransferase
MPASKQHKGDDGSTGFLGEGRIPKNHPRIEALGTLDEASAALGMARALTQNNEAGNMLKEAQKDLYNLMAEIAAAPEHAHEFRKLDNSRLKWLDSRVNELESRTHVPREFILPGDSLPGAALALARTIVRRAERRVVELGNQGEISNEVMLPYLNRLSLLCFLLELAENQSTGREISLAKE